MQKINIKGLNRLRNHDFPSAYKRIVFHLGLEVEDFKVVDVQQAYESIVAHDVKLTKIKNGMAKHKLSKPIALLRDKRHQNLLSLRGRVVYYLRSPFAEERVAASNIFDWLEKERNFLRSCSIDSQTQSVNRMSDDLLIEDDLAADLEKLNVSDLLDSIVSTTKQLDLAIAQRTIDQRQTKKKNQELRDEAFTAMEVFVVALEQSIALNKGDEDVYRECLNGIKNTIAVFTIRYDSEATRKQNAKVEAEAQAKAKAKAEAEAKQNEQPGEGVQYGANVVTMGGKPAAAGRSVAFKTMSMDDMDLQNEGATMNVAMKSAPAMNEQTTNGGVTDGVNEKANDASAGAQGMSDSENRTLGDASATVPSTNNTTATTHNGATTKDDDGVDHES